MGNPKVVQTIVIAYNQERFIAEAMEGVLAQKGDFVHRITVIEDCSTDSTPDILKGYAALHPNIDLVLAPVNECNNRRMGATIAGSDADYIAIMDGDDYWTSNHKLQKQMDFLEAHRECSMCFHNVLITFEDSNQPARVYRESPPAVSDLRDLLLNDFMGAFSSAMFRGGLVRSYPDWFPDATFGDWSLFLLHALQGRVGYLEEVMGVFRKHSGGFWSGRSEVSGFREVIRFFENVRGTLGPEYREVVDERLIRARVHLIQALLESGDAESAKESQAFLKTQFPRELPMIRSFGPNPILARTPFNQQADGNSAVWVICDGTAAGAFIRFNGRALPSQFHGPNTLTAIVPCELYGSPGHAPLSVSTPVGESDPVAITILPESTT